MTITKSDLETHNFAKSFAKSISTFTIISLVGELGAGKTCFVRGLCDGLDGDPKQVNSPTFTIMQEYEIGQGRRLVHIDAYRLSGEDELETIGWDDLLLDQQVVIAVEWGSRIDAAFPVDTIRIHIDHVSPTSREIKILVV
jgi:tRNA threonylcarbamoyladenosine biosynthesis protein TsaE